MRLTVPPSLDTDIQRLLIQRGHLHFFRYKIVSEQGRLGFACLWCQLFVLRHRDTTTWIWVHAVNFVAVVSLRFKPSTCRTLQAWWRHQMETFSELLAFCAGYSTVNGEFPSQRPVTRSFDVFFYSHLNKRLSKQSWGWWFEMPSSSLWRHFNGLLTMTVWGHIMFLICDFDFQRDGCEGISIQY